MSHSEFDTFPLAGERRILLHSCCAPCSAHIISRLQDSGVKTTILFFNPNIYPLAEYQKRKDELARYALKRDIPVVDLDYDPDEWLQQTLGLEDEPERGQRCAICFLLRMKRTAHYAHNHDFRCFATSLSFSRWKDIQQVHAAGREAAEAFSGICFWDINWRKQGGVQQAAAINKEKNFYQQSYCGCIYSLKEFETRRQKKDALLE